MEGQGGTREHRTALELCFDQQGTDPCETQCTCLINSLESSLTPPFTDVSSLSGSESDSDAASNTDAGSSTEDRVTRLLRRQTLKAGPQDDGVDSDQEAEDKEYRRRAELRTAIVWFQAKNPQGATPVPDDTQLGIYRALIPQPLTEASTFLPALRALQLPPTPAAFDPFEERKVTLLMVAGGHFAGMVVSLRPLNLQQGKGLKPERQEVKGAGEVRVLRHKTFHRYTSE